MLAIDAGKMVWMTYSLRAYGASRATDRIEASVVMPEGDCDDNRAPT